MEKNFYGPCIDRSWPNLAGGGPKLWSTFWLLVGIKYKFDDCCSEQRPHLESLTWQSWISRCRCYLILCIPEKPVACNAMSGTRWGGKRLVLHTTREDLMGQLVKVKSMQKLDALWKCILSWGIQIGKFWVRVDWTNFRPSGNQKFLCDTFWPRGNQEFSVTICWVKLAWGWQWSQSCWAAQGFRAVCARSTLR